MKNLLFITLLVLVFFTYSKEPVETVQLPYVEEIPGDNYRSKQLSLSELGELLSFGKIKVVVRLNGDGNDADGVSVEAEANLCEQYGVRFYRIDAHQGYQKGRGYVQTGEIVSNLFQSGDVLVHCKHGFDRTGSVVAYHLRKEGYSKSAIIEINGWEAYLERKGKRYRKYYEALN